MATTPHSRRRPAGALLVAAPTALALALGVGYVVGRDTAGGDPGSTGAPSGERREAGAGDASPISAALAPADSCDALLASYVRRGEEAVTAYGWDAGVVELGDVGVRGQVMPFGGAARANVVAPRTTRATSSDTGTNVQEAGVDEADVVKTDGERLVRVVGDVLEVHDLTGERPRLLGELALDEVRGGELLLDGDRAVVLGRDQVSRHRQRVLVVDLADPADPQVVSSETWGGALLSARLHAGAEGSDGGVVRLVMAPALPDLDFVQPGRRRSWREAERTNRRVVRRSSIEDWLPRRDGEPALGCEDVEVPADPDAPLGTVAVTAFTTDAPEEASVTALAAGAATAYSSPDRLYLADAPPAWGWAVPGMAATRIAMPLPEDDGIAQVHAFALDGTDTTPVASGEVEGAVADRWSMDSVDGVLRVAVGPSRRTDNANAVVTLAEQDGELVERGRVGGLGRGEDIKAVRWFDDLAIVVTFRQVDPLYTVDLSEPTRPELIGTLKIPGFSDYLHPLGPRRMIGVGQSTGRWGMGLGAQAALFKVRDLTDPQRLDVVDWPRRSTAGASTDPRQFTWLPDRRTALVVISKGRRGWLSVLRVEDGQLTSDLREVEDGVEVADVRTVPLPSGQVVLVTREDVSFLDLGPAPR